MDDLVYFYPQGHEGHFERGHPERPERVQAVQDGLVSIGAWEPYPKLSPLEVPSQVLEQIHDPSYLGRLRQASASGRRFDLDTYLTTQSWELALQAAGGAIAVASAVWDAKARRGFALTRPPGHHATPTQAMGFCLLNNVALAAEYLLQRTAAARIAIVDIDLHHGNGTQDIFYHREEVFYFSTHQYPLYPGTGLLEERGRGAGNGFTANVPLPPHSGDEAILSAMNRIILPLLDRFAPEILLISAGFDTHWRDPLGQLLVSAETYGQIVGLLRGWADQHCEGKISLFLEGGYDLEAGAACGGAAASALLGIPWNDPLGSAPWQESDAWQEVISDGCRIWDL